MNPNDPQGASSQAGGQSVQPVQPLGQPLGVTPEQVQALLDQEQSAAQQPVGTQQQVQQPPVESDQPQVAGEVDATDDEQFDDEGEFYDEDLDANPVTWSAHEYIHKDKGTGWFIAFGGVIAALIAVSIFLMNSWTFVVLLVIIAIVVVVYTRRPPRELTYTLNNDGLVIDQTLHKFEAFKSFGVIQDDGEYSVMLIPTQRFQPGITVYFPEDAGEDIVDVLGSRLPMRELHLDAVDRIVRLLRL